MRDRKKNSVLSDSLVASFETGPFLLRPIAALELYG
jgi:hypothetical protein